MGVYLQSAAWAFPGLTPHERVALATYAWSAVDKDDDPRTWCGWEVVASKLGRGSLDLDAPELLTKSDARAVERLTAALIRKGAMTRLETAHRGYRAVYGLAPLRDYMPQRKARHSVSGSSPTLNVGHYPLMPDTE